MVLLREEYMQGVCKKQSYASNTYFFTRQEDSNET